MATENVEQVTIRDRAMAQVSRAFRVYSNLDLISRISLWMIIGIVFVAVFADVIAPYDPIEPDYTASVQGPSWEMRGVDIMISFPSLVLALALVGAVGASLQNIIIVIAIVYTPQYARLIRGDVLSVKEEEFVEAARGTGLSELKVLRKHVIPNAFTPVFVQATFHVATAIIFEASLSFLGLGVQPPTPTWGVLIADGRRYLPSGWWISTFPGLAIMFTVLAFNIFGIVVYLIMVVSQGELLLDERSVARETSRVDTLERLQELKESGALTEDEFEEEKQELLDSN